MENELTGYDPAFANDLDRQTELFKRFGLPVGGIVMSENAIVPTNDGYKLVKRPNPVNWVLDGECSRCVSMVQRTYAEKTGIGEVAREHPNPETQARLVENLLVSSVEVGETPAWAGM